MMYSVQNFHLLTYGLKAPEGVTRILILLRSIYNLAHLQILLHQYSLKTPAIS
jgi:hypothetical protein